MTTACAATTPRSHSRASSPTWSAATRRPTSPGCARSSSASSPTQPCEVCNGYRLKPEALAVKIDGLHIGQVCATCRSATPAAGSPTSTRSSRRQQKEIAARILKEIRERLNFLNNVGLDYLTLARAAGTLSGGESQRIRLASQIGSGLTGVLYVLDEPSHRPAPARQRPAARTLETPARPRQHRARRRA